MYWLDIAPRSLEGAPAPPKSGANLPPKAARSRRSRHPGELRGRKLVPTVGVSNRPLADHLHMRPLIGVTTSELRPSAMATTRRHGEPAHPEMALGMTYLRTLDAAGAIPVVLPPTGTDHIPALLDRLDGLCLSG